MSVDVLALLEEMKQRMIDGTPFDMALAFSLEECIQTLRAAGSERAQPAQPVQTGTPPVQGYRPEATCSDHTRYVADSVEELNNVIRDEPVQDRQDHPGIGGAIAGAAERLGGMLRRDRYGN